MKKTKLKNVVTKLLTILLTALGFSACEKYALLEYGSPHADYEIKGKVTEKENKKEIAGIRVIVKNLPEYEWQYNDTLYTDKAGEFVFIKAGENYSSKQFRIIYEEVTEPDQEAVLKKDSIEVTLEQVEKGKSWYEGKYQANINLEMEKKK